MAGKIDVSELSAEVREQLGLSLGGSPANGGKAKRRGAKMTADEVRTYALRALAPLAALTKSERTRVLKHALRVNEV